MHAQELLPTTAAESVAQAEPSQRRTCDVLESESPLQPNTRLVIIWPHYGPYHLARVAALETAGFHVIGYSYANLVPSYEFFTGAPANHRIINDCTVDAVNPLRSWWRTLVQLWRDKPDLVLACGYERPETLAAVVYARLMRLGAGQRPIAMMMLDNQFDDKTRSRLFEMVKRIYLKVADGFLVGGRTHIEYLARLRVNEAKIRIGYDCVDNDRIARVAQFHRRIGTRDRCPGYFLTLGRLIPKKNTSLVLRAYSAYQALLPADMEPWHLVIAGDGPMYRTLMNEVATGGLEATVRLEGRVDQFEEVVRYYALCRAFILASNQAEQWGLVVNEAMAAGVPVLVSKQCGCSGDLVRNGHNGFTFDANSVRELTDLLLWLHLNERELAQMGTESTTIVSEYSPSHFARNVGDLYRLASSRTRHGPQAPARSGEPGITAGP